jgi:uncharacterized protein YycO
MYLILCTNRKNVFAWLLRFLMWSKWSHSAIFDQRRGVVYDSTFFGGGVRVTPSREFFERHVINEQRHVHVPTSKLHEARYWLDLQVGKPYDWTALLSWVVRRDWQQEDAWFCSELSETFRTLYSRPIFRAEMSRITPRHQDMVA